MRPRFKSIAIYAAALLMLTLMACEGADLSKTDDLPSVNVDTFTTEGKPTKTVQTPWGDKQVYDPTQDAEIIEAFEYVYKNLPERLSEIEKGEDVENPSQNLEAALDEDFKNYVEFFQLVRNIQSHDLLRAGCSKTINTQHCDFEEHENMTSIHKNCENISFGLASLNDCEVRNSKWVQKDVILLAQSPCIEDKSGEEHALFSFWQIGMKNNPNTETITDKNLPVGMEAQIQSYFLSECRTFAR